MSSKNYNQKTKRNKVPIFIALCGLLIGGVLAGIGLFKKIDADNTNKARAEAAQTESEQKYAAAQEEYANVVAELDTYNARLNDKIAECANISLYDFSSRVICQNEESNLRKDVSSLDSRKFQLENMDFTVYYSIVESITYLVFFYIAAGIFVSSLIAAGIVYLVTNRKK